MPPEVAAWSLNHWTTREVPIGWVFFDPRDIPLWQML